jgi:hypothetical protein
MHDAASEFLIKRTGESFIDLYPPNDFFSFGGANIKPVNVFSQNLDLVEKSESSNATSVFSSSPFRLQMP